MSALTVTELVSSPMVKLLAMVIVCDAPEPRVYVALAALGSNERLYRLIVPEPPKVGVRWQLFWH